MTLENLKSILDSQIEFIESYRGLLDTNNVQFLVDKHWSNESILPAELRHDMDQFLVENSSPANLIKYFLNPDSNLYQNLNSLFNKIKYIFNQWDQEVLTDQEFLLKTNSDDLNEFNSIIKEKFSIIEKQNRFMKIKKSYEVDHMSKFVAKLCKKQDIYTLVDIGSGRAYLSAQLSSSVFDNLFNVIAIDSSEHNVESTIKRLDIMKRKTAVKQEENRFKTFSQFIQSSTELEELIKTNCENNNKIDQEDYALIGLHSCGNLSNSIINLYLNKQEDFSKKKKLLCNVACCYNLLNEKYSRDFLSNYDFKKTNIKLDDSSKFPMSFYLNSKQYALSYNMRMLACHSLYRCIESIHDFKELNNSTLWYRTVLQIILYENYKSEFPVESSSSEIVLQVGRKLIDFKSMPSFVDYVRNVLKKFNLSNDKLTDEQINNYMNLYSDMKPRLDLYIQLKYLMAPVIEYVILLDRLIYLYEVDSKNYEHYLVKLFDSAKSPRCHALISFNK